MPTRTEYATGVPCWVDIAFPDLDASVAFYGSLLGWEAGEAGSAEETGGYRLFRRDDHSVAGLAPLMNEQQPTSWTTYISTDDAAATADRIKAAGGTTVFEPFPVTDAGHMGGFVDTAGAFFAIWQPGQHIGADLVNEPGALTWNELATREMAAAKEFYADVFGWQGQTHPVGDTTYTEFKLDGQPVAGMLEMGAAYPQEVPPHWLAYFAVDDADATLGAAKKLGGRPLLGPMDIPQGRFAVLADPHGAAFAVIAPAEGG